MIPRQFASNATLTLLGVGLILRLLLAYVILRTPDVLEISAYIRSGRWLLHRRILAAFTRRPMLIIRQAT